jgi:hypothetical protein
MIINFFPNFYIIFSKNIFFIREITVFFLGMVAGYLMRRLLERSTMNTEERRAYVSNRISALNFEPIDQNSGQSIDRYFSILGEVESLRQEVSNLGYKLSVGDRESDDDVNTFLIGAIRELKYLEPFIRVGSRPK